MPELPEVETVRRGLEPVLTGRTITAVHLARPDLRFALPKDFVARLQGRRVVEITRRAKYLIATLDSGDALLMHLGMTGRFTVVVPDGRAITLGELYFEPAAARTHDHVVFDIEDGHRVVYNDARRFGFMLLIGRDELETHPLLAGLGLEPTGNALSAEALAPRFAGRAAPLKAILSDQRVIAGLGNIYACEALWRARLSPLRAAGTLVRANGHPAERLQRLTEAVRAVIRDAIEAGGSSLRDYVQADGTLGMFQHTFAVYDREGAPCQRHGCRGRIRRIVQSGRSTFHCPVCQR
jgi:formamidopyrimidine-DNA glycosylase